MHGCLTCASLTVYLHLRFGRKKRTDSCCLGVDSESQNIKFKILILGVVEKTLWNDADDDTDDDNDGNTSQPHQACLLVSTTRNMSRGILPNLPGRTLCQEAANHKVVLVFSPSANRKWLKWSMDRQIQSAATRTGEETERRFHSCCPWKSWHFSTSASLHGSALLAFFPLFHEGNYLLSGTICGTCCVMVPSR